MPEVLNFKCPSGKVERKSWDAMCVCLHVNSDNTHASKETVILFNIRSSFKK